MSYSQTNLEIIARSRRLLRVFIVNVCHHTKCGRFGSAFQNKVKFIYLLRRKNSKHDEEEEAPNELFAHPIEIFVAHLLVCVRKF